MTYTTSELRCSILRMEMQDRTATTRAQLSAMRAEMLERTGTLHMPDCPSLGREEWSGSPADADPDNEWECDDCGAIIPAT